jgi:hypothetical protein
MMHHIRAAGLLPGRDVKVEDESGGSSNAVVTLDKGMRFRLYARRGRNSHSVRGKGDRTKGELG